MSQAEAVAYMRGLKRQMHTLEREVTETAKHAREAENLSVYMHGLADIAFSKAAEARKGLEASIGVIQSNPNKPTSHGVR